MRTLAQIAFIVWVGIKDAHFTRWLLANDGSQAELNTVVRCLVEDCGLNALFYLKAVALAVFVTITLMYRRQNKRRGDALLMTGSVVSALLMAWWDLALWYVPSIASA